MLSALKNFGVTFLVSALIFGVIAYFATTFVTGQVEGILRSEKEQLDSIIKDSENSSEIVDGDTPSHSSDEKIDGDSFSFLIVTTDYMPGVYNDYILSADDTAVYTGAPAETTVGLLSGNYREAHVSSIVLVRADKENKAFVYMYITPHIRVSTAGGNRTLSEIYYLYGMDKLKDHVLALTGIRADYSFAVSGYDFDEFSTIAGTVMINNQKDVYFDGKYNTYAESCQVEGFDENGEKTIITVPNEHVLSSGELEMTGSRMYTALSVIEHSKSDLSSKQAVAISLAEGYVKTFGAMSESYLRDTLTNIISNRNVVSTDFVIGELSDRFDLFRRSGTFSSVKLNYPCTYKAATDNSPEYFRPDTEKGLEVLEKYRRVD